MKGQEEREAIEEIEEEWRSDRWNGIVRPYTAADVYRLKGSVKLEYSIAKLTSRKLWDLLHREPFVRTLGALTGNQAVQMVEAGLKAIYVSGWQVAADSRKSGQLGSSIWPSCWSLFHCLQTIATHLQDQAQRVRMFQSRTKSSEQLSETHSLLQNRSKFLQCKGTDIGSVP